MIGSRLDHVAPNLVQPLPPEVEDLDPDQGLGLELENKMLKIRKARETSQAIDFYQPFIKRRGIHPRSGDECPSRGLLPLINGKETWTAFDHRGLLAEILAC